MTDEDLAGQGGHAQGPPVPVMPAENVKYSLVRACGITPPSNAKIHAARQAQWFTDRKPDPSLSVSQLTVAYQGTTGAAAIAEIRELLTCQDYQDGSITRTVTGDETIPAVAGADAQYVYCENENASCVMLLARGDLATAVTVRGGDSLADASKLAPLVMTALARA
ncbi:hypothetical protein F0L68_03830 [Solihabitans fulvus]|uniref:Uncharacterized protein n=1 Tax=Solihabitans fulvus TaxID=1892852 RepID=A0A5B2XS66_9PSEU|nr:hypothetical protein [Solihabitans fulvus]KAA2265711.1 hypothetical protein F0L68_03830 [Solihabitans fulvus]